MSSAAGGDGKRGRDDAAPTSVYEGRCNSCGDARTCHACVATSHCPDCSRSARCGSCRNIHSKAHRAAGMVQSTAQSAKRAPNTSWKSGMIAPARRRSQKVDVADALDLPRSREGLNKFYDLVASTTADLWCVRVALSRSTRAALRFAGAPLVHPHALLASYRLLRSPAAGAGCRGQPARSSTRRSRTSTRRPLMCGATLSTNSTSTATPTPPR